MPNDVHGVSTRAGDDLGKALGEPHMIVGQILLFRQFVKQTFLPPMP